MPPRYFCRHFSNYFFKNSNPSPQGHRRSKADLLPQGKRCPLDRPGPAFLTSSGPQQGRFHFRCPCSCDATVRTCLWRSAWPSALCPLPSAGRAGGCSARAPRGRESAAHATGFRLFRWPC